MKTTIAKFDPTTRTVSVTFTHNGIIHRRPVNAVLDANGAYDKAGTARRVSEVAEGVAHKMDLGLIGPAPGTAGAP